MLKKILIIADIEGSSGCWSYQASQFKTIEWARACVEMSKDIDAVVRALFSAGAQEITVKDFHRTGYNILPELIDTRAKIIHGYRIGPVPGIGDPGRAEAVLMIGMHAASGSNGFLAHTLTSRIAKLEVNGKIMTEAELFASSLADSGIKPIFFSGCPVACQQAKDAIPGIQCCAIIKTKNQSDFDYYAWRNMLSHAAAISLENSSIAPYNLKGPFTAQVTMRDGTKITKKIARQWKFERHENSLYITTSDMKTLYLNLIRICYLTPLIEIILPVGILFYNGIGKLGLWWIRKKCSNQQEMFNN